MNRLNPPEKTKIKGLTDDGKIPIDIGGEALDHISNQLLNLSVKSGLSARIAAIEIGMSEHDDPIISSASVHIVGCSVFTDACESCAGQIATFSDKVLGSSLIRQIAINCNVEYEKVKDFVNKATGFSPKAKERFLKALKEFLNNTIGMNIQGFTVGVAAIIK